jgi:hypothetical protein
MESIPTPGQVPGLIAFVENENALRQRAEDAAVMWRDVCLQARSAFDDLMTQHLLLKASVKAAEQRGAIRAAKHLVAYPSREFQEANTAYDVLEELREEICRIERGEVSV